VNWTIEQRWSHALFLNWKVSEAALQHQVPFPLDLHEGQAVLSLVPFYMDQIRFRGLPSVPVFSRLWELNLRTYVKVNGIPGIYFFTLETPHRLGNFIAKRFFELPYQHAEIEAQLSPGQHRLSAKGLLSDGKLYSLNLEAQTDVSEVVPPPKQDPFQVWVTERYHLFLKKEGRTIRGDVHHEPWKTRPLKVSALQGGISILKSLPAPEALAHCFAGEPLKVRFSPFVVQDNQRLR